MIAESQATIIKCQNCGTANRIPPHAPKLRPICAKCKTPLVKAGEPSPSYPAFGQGFSYHKFVKNVDVKKLIEINTVFDEARGAVFPSGSKCIFCGDYIQKGEAVRLTNNNYICTACFKTVQTIRYPEVYQKKYETFLAEREAQKIGLAEFKGSLSYTKNIQRLTPAITFLNTILVISIAISVIIFLLAKNKMNCLLIGGAVSGSIYAFLYILKNILGHNKKSQDLAISEWIRNNSAPTAPVLKEFHDPSAELTARDKKILEVFDYWPGYPPFWSYVRDVVLNTDKGRCQISGCPNRTELHVHHKRPLSQGGSHKIENLVTLCVFHHSLQPDMGHERIWGEVRTQYFSMVKAHLRNGFPVRAHVRRKELASEEDLEKILSFYSVGCSDCKQYPLKLRVDYHKNNIMITCPFCLSEWQFEQKLPEESGPQISSFLPVFQNAGRWQVDFSLMDTIRKPNYRKGSRAETNDQKTHRRRFEPRQQLFCPKCGRLLKQKRGRYGRFWGCSGYPDCTYTRDF